MTLRQIQINKLALWGVAIVCMIDWHGGETASHGSLAKHSGPSTELDQQRPLARKFGMRKGRAYRMQRCRVCGNLRAPEVGISDGIRHHSGAMLHLTLRDLETQGIKEILSILS